MSGATTSQTPDVPASPAVVAARAASARRSTRQELERAKIEGWFASHVANLTTYTAPDGRKIEQLTWRRPESRYYAITYVAIGGVLSVFGDLGEAIYVAGASGVRWWAGCELGYFARKCLASPSGRGFTEWDAEAALANLEARFEDDEQATARAAWLELFPWQREEALASASEWAAFLRAEAESIWGPNWTDEEPWKLGEVIALHCQAHLVGLQLAVAQLAGGAR